MLVKKSVVDRDRGVTAALRREILQGVPPGTCKFQLGARTCRAYHQRREKRKIK